MPVSASGRIRGAARRPTNVTLPEALLHDAKALNINVSKACEHGLAAEVKRARADKWLSDNREGIAAWNAYIEEHGLPLAEFRQF
jgi:antitoxin CcdA